MSKTPRYFTVPQLARMAGISRFAMGRLLGSRGVKFTMNGRTRYVSLSEIETKLAEFGLSDRLGALIDRQHVAAGTVQSSMPPSRDKKRINVRASEDEHHMLAELAERYGLTQSDVVRQWIRHFHAKEFGAPPLPGRPVPDK